MEIQAPSVLIFFHCGENICFSFVQNLENFVFLFLCWICRIIVCCGFYSLFYFDSLLWVLILFFVCVSCELVVESNLDSNPSPLHIVELFWVSRMIRIGLYKAGKLKQVLESWNRALGSQKRRWKKANIQWYTTDIHRYTGQEIKNTGLRRNTAVRKQEIHEKGWYTCRYTLVYISCIPKTGI